MPRATSWIGVGVVRRVNEPNKRNAAQSGGQVVQFLVLIIPNPPFSKTLNARTVYPGHPFVIGASQEKAGERMAA